MVGYGDTPYPQPGPCEGPRVPTEAPPSSCGQVTSPRVRYIDNSHLHFMFQVEEPGIRTPGEGRGEEESGEGGGEEDSGEGGGAEESGEGGGAEEGRGKEELWPG